MKYHRATEQREIDGWMDGLLGEDNEDDDEEEFLQPYIVSNPF